MIGGLFKPAGYASIAAAGLLLGSVSAQAADLGGNCCADLEERVAELEATTARKGNRKVSLEVSGHVNEAIVFWDANGSLPGEDESNVYIGTHNASRSRFRFKGSARITADWSAGFLMEIGVRANHLGSNTQDSPYNVSGLDIRHEALYLKSNTLGTVWLGWTSSATDGITEICLGCGLGNGPDYSDDMGNLQVGGQSIDLYGGGHGAFIGEGDRREVVRYISPTLAGFVLSAAYGQDDFYDVALRYAGEFGAIRIAGGVGYQYDSSGATNPGAGFISSAACSAVGTDAECEQVGASLSIQHTPTGLYLAGAYGLSWDNRIAPALGDTVEGWHVTGGVNQKFFAIGATNIWGMYTYSQDEVGFLPGEDQHLTVYGAGIEQNIDAAAMSIYFWWKRMEAYDTEINEGGETDQFVLGSRIRF